jgi:hypothetical protein
MPAILRCDLTPGSTVHLLRLYDPSRNIGCSNESENASVKKFHYYYGDDFKVECTAGSRKYITLQEVAAELTRRISRLFLSGADGQRPVLKYQRARRRRITSDRLDRPHREATAAAQAFG